MTSTDLIRIAVFEGKHIRKIIHGGEWWFAVIDIIEVLTGSDRPRKYWSDLKKKLLTEGYIEVSEKIGQLKSLGCRRPNLLRSYLHRASCCATFTRIYHGEDHGLYRCPGADQAEARLPRR